MIFGADTVSAETEDSKATSGCGGPRSSPTTAARLLAAGPQETEGGQTDPFFLSSLRSHCDDDDDDDDTADEAPTVQPSSTTTTEKTPLCAAPGGSTAQMRSPLGAAATEPEKLHQVKKKKNLQFFESIRNSFRGLTTTETTVKKNDDKESLLLLFRPRRQFAQSRSSSTTALDDKAEMSGAARRDRLVKGQIDDSEESPMSLFGSKRRGKSLYVKRPTQQHDEGETHAVKPGGPFHKFRRTTSLLAGLEDDACSHAHTVIKPKTALTVQSELAASRRATVVEAWCALGCILVLSCAFYYGYARWSFVDALYFTIVTLATVGYGDQVPVDRVGKVFAVILFFLGAGALSNLVGAAFTVYVEDKKCEETKAKRDSLRLRGKARRRRWLRERREAKNPWKRVRQPFILLALWTFGGAACFQALEGHGEGATFIDAVYWSGATLTTTGYGDYHPQTTAAKVFAIFFILGGTYVCLNALSSIASIPIEAHRRKVEEAVLSQYGDTLTQEEFLELTRGEFAKDLDLINAGGGKQSSSSGVGARVVVNSKATTTLTGAARVLTKSDEASSSTKTTPAAASSSSLGVITHGGADGRRVISKAAFALAMLVKLGRVESDDVYECFMQFDRLDHHHHGYLALDDVDDENDDDDDDLDDDDVPAVHSDGDVTPRAFFSERGSSYTRAALFDKDHPASGLPDRLAPGEEVNPPPPRPLSRSRTASSRVEGHNVRRNKPPNHKSAAAACKKTQRDFVVFTDACSPSEHWKQAEQIAKAASRHRAETLIRKKPKRASDAAASSASLSSASSTASLSKEAPA